MTLSLVPFSRRVQDRSTCTTSEPMPGSMSDSLAASTLTNAAPASKAPLVNPSAISNAIESEGRGKQAPLHGPDPDAIAAQDIQMTYRNGSQSQTVLHGIGLSIQPGTVQLLMGPSGSGKTTLLSILGGILSPTAGHVDLLGTRITDLSKRQLAKFRLHNIGFIFQGFNLFDALTATENIVVALKMRGIRPRQARQEALYWLEQVGLADKAHHLPKNLSGGQKQRVAIARALAGNPPLIMADEPTAALDSHSGHRVIEMLCTLAKESDRTVLMVTHDPRIKDVADRITYLEDGKIQMPDVTSDDPQTTEETEENPDYSNSTIWPKSA